MECMLLLFIINNIYLSHGYIFSEIKFTTNDTRNAATNTSLLWPMATVYFDIDTLITAAEKNLILTAMHQFQDNTCIRFKERVNEKDYVHIFKDTSCYTYVGRIGGKQDLSLGNGCANNIGTVVNQFGHIVGFYHEHNRSDRDEYLEIHAQNIETYYIEQFRKMAPNENRLLSPFDYESIMMLGPHSFGKPGLTTISAKKTGVSLREVSDKTGLTHTDIVNINLLYSCTPIAY